MAGRSSARIQHKQNPTPRQDYLIIETAREVMSLVNLMTWKKATYKDEAHYHFAIEVEGRMKFQFVFYPERSRLKAGAEGYTGGSFDHDNGSMLEIFIQLAMSRWPTKAKAMKSARFLTTLSHEIIHALDSYRLEKILDTNVDTSKKNWFQKYTKHGFEKNARILTGLLWLTGRYGYNYTDEELRDAYEAFEADKVLADIDCRSFLTRAALLRTL